MVHGVLHREDGLRIILLFEGLALEGQVLCGWQGDDIEPLRNVPGVVRHRFNSLHIGGGIRLLVRIRQPEADRLAAQRVHTGQHTPDLAADLRAVGKVVLGPDAALEDDLALRLADHLDENALQVFHINGILSQLLEFHAIGDEQPDGDGVLCVVPGVASKFPVEGAGEPVHTLKAAVIGRVGDKALLTLQTHGGTGQAHPADIFRWRESHAVLKETVRVPGRKERYLGESCQRDLLV